jgi:anti-repressor protein
MTSKITVRDGRSIQTDLNKIPKKTLTSALEFTEEQANRMMRTRRVLPLVENRQEPQIDARKLWEKIGKPHGRFRDYAEDYIKPMIGHMNFAGKGAKTISGEIESFYEATGKKGRPKTNYLLSRDVATHLAMQARTPEGRDIRQYFIDMEQVVVLVERYRPIRTHHLIEIDNSLYHHAVSLSGSKSYAQETERFFKGMAAEVISGLSASEWREALKDVHGAKGKGIRDVLDQNDLKLYLDALRFAAQLFQSGITDRGTIESMVRKVHADNINPEKYLGYECKAVA